MEVSETVLFLFLLCSESNQGLWCMLSKHFTTELSLQPSLFFFNFIPSFLISPTTLSLPFFRLLTSASSGDPAQSFGVSKMEPFGKLSSGRQPLSHRSALFPTRWSPTSWHCEC
jgi:hypothetical protein